MEPVQVSELEELTDAPWMDPPEGGGMPVTYKEYIDNIRANCRLELPNLKHVEEHDRVMVMVCGGPSAGLFLPEIRKKSLDPKYDVFCSNKTHDWLIENGIKPYCQFIIDPKEAMLKYVQNPQPGVRYMIGLQCNPGVFEALKGHDVMRVISYANLSAYQDVDPNDKSVKDHQIIRAFFDENDYDILEGGTMAGLRAMPLGNILGYLTVEFYGFDSCFFDYDKKKRPIYYVYDKKRLEDVLEVQTDDGKLFYTSPVFASQARQFVKWKERLGWIKFVIHGDGLTAKVHELHDEKTRSKHDRLFSKLHQDLNRNQHIEKHLGRDSSYGTTGRTHAGQVAVLVGSLIKKYGDTTLLDYGCGKNTLVESLPPITGLSIQCYDPSIEEHAASPEPADIVVCTDVLEHIEPDCLENVLDHLHRLTKKVLFATISTMPAKNFSSDGQNLHKIVEPLEWWYPKFRKRWDVVEKKTSRSFFIVICQSKELREEAKKDREAA